MKRYDVEYQFVSKNGDDGEYESGSQILLSVNENTLNRLKALFWVKILSVKEIKVC